MSVCGFARCGSSLSLEGLISTSSYFFTCSLWSKNKTNSFIMCTDSLLFFQGAVPEAQWYSFRCDDDDEEMG